MVYTGNQTPGRHGNSSHGISAAVVQLRKGQPFDGHLRDLFLDALSRRGLDEATLAELAGPYSDYTKNVARYAAVVDLVWGGLSLAGACGDVAGFLTILEKHGSRFSQLGKMLESEIDLQKQQSEILDLTDAVKVAEDAT